MIPMPTIWGSTFTPRLYRGPPFIATGRETAGSCRPGGYAAVASP